MPNHTLLKLFFTAVFCIVVALFYQWFSTNQPGSESITAGSDIRTTSHTTEPHTTAEQTNDGQEKQLQISTFQNDNKNKHQNKHTNKSPTKSENEQSFKTAYQNKQRYAQERAKQVLAEMNPHTEGQNKAELMEQHAESIATRQQMRIAAKNGDWEAFLDIRKKLNDMMGAGDLLSLLDAIQFNAPKHVFQELLRTGSQFTEDMLMFLVVNDDVDLVKMLISLGFDIHMTDRYEKNALLYSIEFNAPNVFSFLLTQSISVEPSVNGPDALDTALEALLKPQNNLLIFTNSLLKSIPYIKPSHTYLLSQLEQQRPEIYQRITSQHTFLHE